MEFCIVFWLCQELKESRALNTLSCLTRFFLRKYNVDWIGRDGLSPESHEAYLTDLVNHFYKNVVKLVQRGMKKENIKTDSPLVYELLHHLHECQKSVKNFCGRELELRKMEKYLTGETSKTPLFVFGKGGSGKTALLSQACLLLQSEWSRQGKVSTNAKER